MTERQLARVASDGLLWTYGSIILTLLIQVGYTAVTARAVGPAVFGAYAASQALAMLLSYLSLSTVGNAVSRTADIDDHLLGTAWSLAAGGGLVAAAAAVLIAPWWASLWNVEHVTLVALAAPTVLLLPASNLALALLRRRLDYRRAAVIEFFAAVVGMGGMGVSIAVTRQVWLLALAMPISLLISTAFAAVLAGARPRFCWRTSDARLLGAFVAPVTGQYLIHYLAATWPQLLFGRLFGSAALGQLSRCTMLVMMPSAHIAGGLSKVLFPLLNQVRDDRQRHRRTTTRLLVLASGISAVAFGILTGASEPLVRVLLGEQWRATAHLVPVIGLGAGVNLLLVLTSNVLENAMRTRAIWLSQGTLLATAGVITIALLAADAATPLNVLWIFTGAQFTGHAAQLVRLVILRMVEPRALLSAYAVHAGIGLTVFAALTLASDITAGAPVAVSCAWDAAVLGGLSALVWRGRRWIPGWTTASSLGLTGRSHHPVAVP